MNLKDYFENRLATQGEIAAAVGVTQGYVSHWCKGRSQIPAEKVLQLYWATDGNVSPHEMRPDIYPDPEWVPSVAGESAA